MIVLLLLSLAYVLPWALWKPQPGSLREKASQVPVGKRLWAVKGNLALGILLILFFFLTSGGEWKQSTPDMVGFWGLWKGPGLPIFQWFTCNFIHFDFLHLIGNLSVLCILAAYERRKGAARTLLVFAVSGLVSSLGSYVFLPENTVCLGASGGICGLAGAYFTDSEEMGFKEWLTACLAILFLVGFFSVAESWEFHDYQIDHAGHLFGALGGVLFCRLFPDRPLKRGA